MSQKDVRKNRGKYATIIRTPDQRLRVFVSSTLKELEDEREAAREAISTLRLTPVMFELGARPHPARELYQAYLAQSHVFIGIYWQRYGWVAPGMEVSGLEDEYLLAKDLPKLIYFKTPAPDRETGLIEMIKRIKSDDQVSYKYFSSAEELLELIQNDLAVLLTERFEQGRQRDVEEFPASQKVQSSRLPRLLTGVIGREKEIQKVRALLTRPDVRLVTMSGPGGVGKTRLSLEVAAGLEGNFEHGVYWVNLASIQNSDLVISTIAQVLDVRERVGYSLMESLQEYLRDKRLLLVLDNFEQVVDAGPALADLLSSAPGLQALVTSRSSLRLRGEREFPVPPLKVPSSSGEEEVERLMGIPSVRLFVERAQAAKPNFDLVRENAPVVTEIVQHLDGLPLAIELAAARIKLLTPDQILKRLNARLELLTGGAQDLPARHQTMRSAIEWSYNLLDPSDRKLFSRLGIFIGGFTLEAAETVCNPDGDLDVFDGIASLVNNSLLRQEEAVGEHPRFQMLETIREYALEKLLNTGEEASLRRAHANYFSELANIAWNSLFSSEIEDWLDRLEADYGNFRKVLDWSQSSDEYKQLAWNIILNLIWLWYRRGYLNEARQWYETAMEETAQIEDDFLRGSILCNAGLVLMWQSDLKAAERVMDEGLDLMRQFEGSPDFARVLFQRGVLAVNRGDMQKTRSILQEALPLFARIDQSWFIPMIKLHLGNVALSEGDLPLAEAFMQESLKRGQHVGDRWIIASAINNFGELARYKGDLERAEDDYLTSQDLFQSVGSSPDIARAFHSLGWIALSRQETNRAQSLFERALELHEQLGVKRGVIESLAGLAAVIGAQGDLQQAVSLFSFVRHQFEELGTSPWPADRVDQERALSALREHLDDVEYNDAWARGREMSLAQVMRIVRNPRISTGEK